MKTLTGLWMLLAIGGLGLSADVIQLRQRATQNPVECGCCKSHQARVRRRTAAAYISSPEES